MSPSHLPKHIQALLSADFYEHTVSKCSLLETHISWVILTGKYAYKIKKPVNFGFLNFETLDKRKFYCNEELRLNKRIASELYIEVLAVKEKKGTFSFSGNGEVVDYVLKMHQFPQQSRFDKLLDKHQLNERHLGKTAEMLAWFHHQCETAQKKSPYGTALQVHQPVLDNFQQIDYSSLDDSIRNRLDVIRTWSETTFRNLQGEFQERKQKGFVRECHGDLHLSNLAWLDNQPLAFDCLEFNAELRWIDVISDIAFLIMDLHRCQQFELAQFLLHRYLEYSGDYNSLNLLAYYLCYRAVVMTKVESLRLSQINQQHSDFKATKENFSTYLQLAEKYTQTNKPMLMICHGLSASGKSTISEKLLQRLPAIKISSDIERKRLVGSWPIWSQGSQKPTEVSEQKLYSSNMNQRVYEHLMHLAKMITGAGYNVIVDATFLKAENRSYFFNFAQQNRLKFLILNFKVPFDILRQRIVLRKQEISDADLVVLEKQIKQYQPLQSDEEPFCVNVGAQNQIDINQLSHKIKNHQSF